MKLNTERARAAATLKGTSLPKIAEKHGANYKTVHAAIRGTRPGHDPKVRRAVNEIRRLTTETFRRG